MRVKVKRVFFDDNGLHRPDDIIETNNFDPALMEQIESKKEPAKAKKEK